MAFCIRNPWIALLALAIIFCGTPLALAEGPAAFDLQGPKLTVTVTRDGATLPIAEVPNLAVGDQIAIHADFPEQQSAHYLMIAAFLRGSTNPPPEKWFFRTETWRSSDGLNLVVPDGAQQVLVFLAPETGGDFRTLVNAVRGKPGAFVRASQDLNQAALDRSRLDTFLADVKQIQSQDPGKLKQDAPLLGRSLGIKIDDKCFDRATEEQGPCLMHDSDAIILSDGHSQSIVQALTSGAAGDLATQLTYTPQASYGAYSPYLASVMDIARILDSLHTAQYQYIPALGILKDDQMALRLNVPPSFHNPKSVLVAALPAVEKPQPPPLRAANPEQNYCVAKSQLALGVEGAPLVFSTDYAHNTVLHIQTKAGRSVDVPVTADAVKGGLVVQSNALHQAGVSGVVKAQLHGQWGFDKYDGPQFELLANATPHWQLAQPGHQTLIVGKDDIIHLAAGDAGCVEAVSLEVPQANGPEMRMKAEWKAANPHDLEVTLPLKNLHAGEFSLNVKQFGGEVQTFPLESFADEARLTGFSINAGDTHGLLRGAHLDQVTKLEIHGISFAPAPVTAGAATQPRKTDELTMAAKAGRDTKAAAALKPDESVVAEVTLSNGSKQNLDVTVGAVRPIAELITKTIEGEAANGAIKLTNSNELPQDATLTFSVRLQKSANVRNATVEVATEDGSASTTLSADKGTLTPENHNVVVARLHPAKALGEAAFGPLKFRVMEDDAAGEWIPLATLVRLPQLRKLDCAAGSAQPCILDGSNLFLMDAVAVDASFAHAVQVPDGFTGDQLQVPHPAAGGLLVKLRDDPEVVNQVTLSAAAAAPEAKSPPAETPAPAPAPEAKSEPAETPTPAPAAAPEAKSAPAETPAPEPAPQAKSESAEAPARAETPAAASTSGWHLPAAGMPVAITPVAEMPTADRPTTVAPVAKMPDEVTPTGMAPAAKSEVTGSAIAAAVPSPTPKPRLVKAHAPTPTPASVVKSEPVEQPMPKLTPAPVIRSESIEPPAPEAPAPAPVVKSVPVEMPAPPPTPAPVVKSEPVEQPAPPPSPAPVVKSVPVEMPAPPPTPAPVVKSVPVEMPAPPPTPAPVVKSVPVEQPAPPPTPAPVVKSEPIGTPTPAATPVTASEPGETPALLAAPEPTDTPEPAPAPAPSAPAAPAKAAPAQAPKPPSQPLVLLPEEEQGPDSANQQ